jgi:hypothetical protein
MLLSMSTTALNRPVPGGRRLREATVAGMTASAFFVLVFLVEGWLRPGYQPSSMFVSELSLGPRGWVQIINFLVTGALLIVFARAAAPDLRGGRAGAAGPILLQIIGLSLMASGPFLTDPSAQLDQRSVHGLVHDLFGAVVFSLMPVSCFVFYRRFRGDPAWRRLATWSLAAAVALVVGIAVLKVAQQPDSVLFAWKGLVQRAVLVAFMSWVFTVAAHLRHAVGG